MYTQVLGNWAQVARVLLINFNGLFFLSFVFVLSKSALCLSMHISMPHPKALLKSAHSEPVRETHKKRSRLKCIYMKYGKLWLEKKEAFWDLFRASKTVFLQKILSVWRKCFRLNIHLWSNDNICKTFSSWPHCQTKACNAQSQSVMLFEVQITPH